jgi:hypothetical protein
MTEETTRRVVTAEARYKASPPSWPVELPGNWRPQSPHRKQADELNRAWADALRASVGR